MLGLRLVVGNVVLSLRPGGSDALILGLNEVRRKINGWSTKKYIHTECVRSFANGTNGMPMPFEVSPLAAIGTNGMPMFTNGYHWFLPLAANLVENLEGRQNYQRAKFA